MSSLAQMSYGPSAPPFEEIGILGDACEGFDGLGEWARDFGVGFWVFNKEGGVSAWEFVGVAWWFSWMVLWGLILGREARSEGVHIFPTYSIKQNHEKQGCLSQETWFVGTKCNGFGCLGKKPR